MDLHIDHTLDGACFAVALLCNLSVRAPLIACWKHDESLNMALDI